MGVVKPSESLDRVDSNPAPNHQGKGKVHPCTVTEALYRPYGP